MIKSDENISFEISASCVINFELTLGERIEWLAVQIRDFRKQPVFCLPDAASIKYSIRLDVQKGGQAPIFSHVCKVPMFSDRHSEGIVEEGAAADKFFFFKELCFSAGIFNIRIVIMDGDREIKSFNRVLKVFIVASYVLLCSCIMFTLYLYLILSCRLRHLQQHRSR